MRTRIRKIKLLFCVIAMLFLIFCSSEVKAACKEGILLCIESVIPSLFPFFCLTSPMVECFAQTRNVMIHKLGKLCGIPQGSEGIIILGLLGGYPMGAKAVCDAYEAGSLESKDAQRMLAFSSNCGPAFLFGMVATLFEGKQHIICLWGIQIFSAVILAALLPGKRQKCITMSGSNPKTAGISGAISAMASVCGWVVIFRIILELINHFLYYNLPDDFRILFSGLLELTNGILLLNKLPSQSLRFLLASIFSSFGGLCVIMQTGSIIKDLSICSYILGKGMQTAISSFLSCLFCRIVFGEMENAGYKITGVLIILGILCFFLYRKKEVEFQDKMMYNTTITFEMGKDHAVS